MKKLTIDEIYEKAKKINAKKRARDDHELQCRLAEICPICGRPLKIYVEKRRKCGILKMKYDIFECPAHGEQWEICCEERD